MKKKNLTVVLFTLLTLNSFSQIFPNGEAIWNRYHSDFFGTMRYTQYLQNGDTLIEGQKYNKLYKSYEQYQFDSLSYSYYKVYNGALRTDTIHNKIYYVPADSTDDLLLYDFNLQVGDTIPLWHNEFSHVITVKSIDTIFVNSKGLKRFEMNYGNHLDPVFGDFIIEGIGSLKDLIQIENRLEGIKGFLCFKNMQTGFKYPEDCNNNTLAINDSESIAYYSISPNPCNNYFSISIEGVETEHYKMEMVDLRGNKVLSTQIVDKNQIISTLELEAGLYVILIYNDLGLKIKEKILINK